MIRVYLLPVKTVDGTEQVAGIDFIHDALLLCTEDPAWRLLIMDTSAAEHNGLVTVGGLPDIATQEEIDLYNSQVIPFTPNPDIARARELLGTSPAVITQPEIWELMRIFGRFHGLAD